MNSPWRGEAFFDSFGDLDWPRAEAIVGEAAMMSLPWLWSFWRTMGRRKKKIKIGWLRVG